MAHVMNTALDLPGASLIRSECGDPEPAPITPTRRVHLPAPRIAPLNGVRALAITMVIGFHAGIPGFAGGSMGVTVFFVLSGFLITGLLMRHNALTRRGLCTFYARRMFRLFPALVMLLMCSVVYAMIALDSAERSYLVRQAIASLTYTTDLWLGLQNGPVDFGYLGHTWSLSVEEQFYLLWPLLLIVLIRWGNRKVALTTTLMVAAASGMLRTYHSSIGDAAHVALMPDTKAEDLLIGCALTLALPYIRVTGRWTRRVLDACGAGGLAILLLCSAIPVHGLLPLDLGFTVVAIATAVLMLSLVAPRPEGGEPALSRTLACRLLTWIADISYSLYLWHAVILCGFKYLVPMPTPADRIAWAPIVLGTIVLAACCSYYFVERPFLALRDRYVNADRT